MGCYEVRAFEERVVDPEKFVDGIEDTVVLLAEVRHIEAVVWLC